MAWLSLVLGLELVQLLRMITSDAAIKMTSANVVPVAPADTRMICTMTDDMATTETITRTTGPTVRSPGKDDEEDVLNTPHHHRISEILTKTSSEQRK